MSWARFRSKHGYEYILLIEDLFTRWVECVTLHRANAKAVIAALKERVMLRFGSPSILLTDNGTEFENQEMQRFLKAYDVQHAFTPPYHPQADPVERANRTVKTMLRAYVEENHRTWDEQLSEMIFAYNSAKHASTGFSPAMLNLSREPAMPHSLCRQVDDETQKQLEREALEEWKRWMERLSLLCEEATANMAQAQENYAPYYNSRRRDVSYAVGDQVWRDNHVLSSGTQGFTAKLALRYLGPFTVTKVLGTNTYELTDAVGVAEGPVHVRQLKPYITPSESADEEEDADDDAMIGEPQPPKEKANQATSDPPSSSESTGSEG